MGKQKLLIFAHYYFPDTASTGQILKDLAEGMLEDFEVTVICVVPSYEGTIEEQYKTKKYYFENLNGVKIIRVRVPEFSKSNKKSRIKNIVTYFFRAIKAAKKSGKQDYVLTISQPPILGGMLGVIGKWMKHAKMIYCIQDFNPEQVKAVNYSSNKFIIKLMLMIDKYSCKHSNLVITVGCDLVKTLENRFKGKKVPKYVMINNWIDEEKIYPLPLNNKHILEFKKKFGLENKFVIMYSGNIGLYYDLENIIKALKQFRKGYTSNGEYESGPKTPDGREVAFAFIGDGSLLDKLISYTKKHKFDNVFFIPYQKKQDLIYSLNSGDVHMCINASGIKGVSCPSKAYGIMAVGKPIIGVLENGSEIRKIIEESKCGKCCNPGDYLELSNIIKWYIHNSNNDNLNFIGSNGRTYLEKNLKKDISINKYIEVIKNL